MVTCWSSFPEKENRTNRVEVMAVWIQLHYFCGVRKAVQTSKSLSSAGNHNWNAPPPPPKQKNKNKTNISNGVSNCTLLTAASAKLALLLVDQRQLLATLSFLLSCKEAAHSLSLHLLFLHTFYEWSLYSDTISVISHSRYTMTEHNAAKVSDHIICIHMMISYSTGISEDTHSTLFFYLF